MKSSWKSSWNSSHLLPAFRNVGHRRHWRTCGARHSLRVVVRAVGSSVGRAPHKRPHQPIGQMGAHFFEIGGREQALVRLVCCPCCAVTKCSCLSGQFGYMSHGREVGGRRGGGVKGYKPACTL